MFDLKGNLDEEAYNMYLKYKDFTENKILIN